MLNCFSAVFQAGGLVVVLVEVGRKAYLASMVPVIVNAILNEHQLVVDIIAFVSKGDFPRSRLGEKQRGKILASWVTRKMRTIAQFAIKDADRADSQITEVAEPRSTIGSTRNGSLLGGPSSLRNVEATPAVVEEPEQEAAKDYAPIPTGISAMPAEYENSIMESPPLPIADHRQAGDKPMRRHRPKDIDSGLQPHNRDKPNELDDAPLASAISPGYYQNDGLDRHMPSLQIDEYDPNGNPYGDELPPEPRYDNKPTLSLPSVTGHESFVPGEFAWKPPSSQGRQQAGRGGGLRVANANSDDDNEWPREAIMHMSLTGTDTTMAASRSVKEARYDGSGYGDAL